MQNARRDFIKKSALTVGATAVGATALAANNDSASNEASSGGVVVGKSSKKEITYKKTKEWEMYYKSAH
ncbi:Formate dehydrogenase subunit or accessory protein [hydrothermal vent metagenome]|uniref:Formate dehydrogenase subunit or accessory protein n=1 Tax=hydrothermal vent metagenome TaxID=652676 RepID=A0A1W1EFU4_9ZZZZ